MNQKLFHLICLTVLLVGCAQSRHWASPEVADMDPESIVTSNKYRVRSFYAAENLPHVVSYVSKQGIQSALAQHYPGIFASDGIPIDVVEGVTSDWENKTVMTVVLPFLVSGTTLPFVKDAQWWRTYTIEVGDSEFDFKTYFKGNGVATILSPIGLFFPYEKNPGIKKTEFTRINVETPFVKDLEKTLKAENTKVESRAVAHGIAVKLKELEDSGMIAVKHRLDDKGLKPLASESSKAAFAQSFSDNSDFISKENTLKTDEVQTQKQNIYRIVSFDRESDSSFAYNFVLALQDENSSLSTLRQIQQEFRMAVKTDYMESFSGVNADSLYVDFSEYKLNNGKIYGRAVVLTIAIESLTYNSNTRTGKLAVKVNANQYEEARKWVRKNIETLARDKNIALVTGEIPPAAKFYLGREEFKDGNILEVEFRTE